MSTGIPIKIAATVEAMNLDDRKAAGERAKTRRKALELTQAELAKQTGLDQSSISDFEQGKYTAPSYEFVVKLARGLRESAEFIFYGRQVDFDTETLEFAEKGQLLGLAFVGIYKGGEYICNTAGFARDNNAPTIGMVRVLGSMLEAKERGL